MEESRKIAVYILPQTGSSGPPRVVLRRTVKNAKGRYITGDEFLSVGLSWPTAVAPDRDALALLIGRALLDEVGV